MGAEAGKTKWGEKKQEFTELLMWTAASLCRAIFGGIHIRNPVAQEADRQADITSPRAGRRYEVLSKLRHFVGDREKAENVTPATPMVPMVTKPSMWQVCPSDFLTFSWQELQHTPLSKTSFPFCRNVN